MDANLHRWRMGQVHHWTADRLRQHVHSIYHTIEVMQQNTVTARRAGWRKYGTFEVKLMEEVELQEMELLLSEIEIAFHFRQFDFQKE